MQVSSAARLGMCLTGALLVSTAITSRSRLGAVDRSADTAWFVFVDDLHLDFRNTGRLRDLLKSLAKGLMRDGDIVSVRSSGPSQLSLPLTADPPRYAAIIKKATGNGLKLCDIVAANGADEEIRYRAEIALQTALAMLDDVERVKDRQAVLVYVSNGYLLDTASGASPPRRTSSSRRSFVSSAPRDVMWDLIRKASQLRIKIFTIDPRGLVGPPAPDRGLDRAAWDSYLAETRDSLREIAEQTGGLSFETNHDLRETVDRISAAVSR